MIHGALIIVVAANLGSVEPGTCEELNQASAPDRAFLEALPTSGIPYQLSKLSGFPCFADADLPRVDALRAEISARNPEACLTFEKAWNVPALEEKLREAGVAVWRVRTDSSGSITICHLTRDKAKVKQSLEEVFPKIK